MFWFKKRRDQERDRRIAEATSASIEFVAEKEATQEAVERAKAANEHLQDLFEKNHFTVKIFVATGGKPRHRLKGNTK